MERSKPVTAGAQLTVEDLVRARKRGDDAFAKAATTRRSAALDVPKEVRESGQVLNFTAYFQEAVPDDPREKARVRHLRIQYFLEDDTALIFEAATENAGMPQGKFLKRGKIPMGKYRVPVVPEPSAKGAAGPRYLHWTDLRVGETLDIVSRSIRISGCDAATRRWYADTPGAPAQPSDLGEPDDVYTRTRADITRRETGRDLTVFRGSKVSPVKRYAEAVLGNSSAWQTRGVRDNLQKFLEHGGDRVQFRGVLDTSDRIAGEKVDIMLYYYLADDTVEAFEVHGNNKGRAPVIKMFSRAKLPRGVLAHDDRTRSIESDNGEDDYYTLDDADFRVGCTIKIMGQPVFLYAADSLAIRHVKETYGVDMQARADKLNPSKLLGEEEDEMPEVEPPPYLGFGGEEDSISSFLHLRPKIPQRDVQKLNQYADMVLRFNASMIPHDETGAASEESKSSAGDSSAAAAGGGGGDGGRTGGALSAAAIASLGGGPLSVAETYRLQQEEAAARSERMAVARDPLWAAKPSDPKAMSRAMAARSRMRRTRLDEVDKARRFVITWFLEDDTLQVFEPPKRNSGLLAGKILTRCKLRNPDTGDFFRTSDFQVGAVLNINGQKYRLDSTDDYSRKVMEQGTHFLMSDVRFVLTHLKRKFQDFSTTARRAFRSMDKDFSGFVTIDELDLQLKKWGMKVSRADLMVLMRWFDQSGDGKISYNDFVRLFTDEDYGEGAGGSKGQWGEVSVAEKAAQEATTISERELKSYEERIGSVQMKDEDETRLTRLLEMLAMDFASKKGEQLMREEFRRVDEDKSNTVDRREFRKALSDSLFLRDHDIALLEKRFFPPGTEELNYESFMQHLRGRLTRTIH